MFIPIAIYNNTKGDADAKGENLIPRVAKDWTTSAFAGAMVDGLKAAKLEVPTWLQLVAVEETAKKRGVETVIFGMA